jgi:hypothetical protein
MTRDYVDDYSRSSRQHEVRLGVLSLHLRYKTEIDPTGDTAVDAKIASVLDVPLLPYTTDDNAARTLLPLGWKWIWTEEGAIGCVRSSWAEPGGGWEVMRDRNGNIVPDALAHCRLAIEVHKLIAREKHHTALALGRR